MKVNTITRTVRIQIDNATLLGLFVQAVHGNAKKATGKDRTFYRALGSLVGISDVDAVKVANSDTKKEHRITVTEFRRRLPAVFSAFTQAVLEASDTNDDWDWPAEKDNDDEVEQLRGSLEAILDESTSDHDRDIIITECQSALSDGGAAKFFEERSKE